MPTNIKEHLNDLHGWTKYKKGLCETCLGLCCYMPVEVTINDLIRLNILTEFHNELSEKVQIKDALKHPGILRYTPSSQKYTFQQMPNGACFFLDQNKRCTQYENRPETCRNHPQVGPKPGFCAYMKK